MFRVLQGAGAQHPILSPQAPGLILFHTGSSVSGSTAIDLSPSGIDGTLTNGCAVIASPWGAAYTFDGDDDFIELGTQAVGTPLQLLGDFTISVMVYWIFVVGVGDGNQRIIDKSSAGAGADGWGWDVHPAAISPPTNINWNVDGGWDEIGGDIMTTATWAHLLLQGGATDCDFWKDGSVVSTGAATNSRPNVQTNCRIGTWNHSTGREFNGRIDRLRIFDRIVTADEIATLANE